MARPQQVEGRRQQKRQATSHRKQGQAEDDSGHSNSQALPIADLPADFSDEPEDGQTYLALAKCVPPLICCFGCLVSLRLSFIANAISRSVEPTHHSHSSPVSQIHMLAQNHQRLHSNQTPSQDLHAIQLFPRNLGRSSFQYISSIIVKYVYLYILSLIISVFPFDCPLYPFKGQS